MELVVVGNPSGYDCLDSIVANLTRNGLDNPAEHVDLDDLSDSRVVKRSVAVSFRGPVQTWGRRALREFWDILDNPRGIALPSDIAYLLKQSKRRYEKICAEDSDFLLLE